MIDIKIIRNKKEAVCKNLIKRNEKLKFLVEKAFNFDKEKILILNNLENKKKQLNEISKKIGILKKNNLKKEIEGFLKKANILNKKIDLLKKKLIKIEKILNNILYNIPNLLLDSVPIGENDKDNILIKEYKFNFKYEFEIKEHYDVGLFLNILDFDRASKISGSRFVFFKNEGAKLVRSLINFMLDYHVLSGYKEILTPLIVNSDSLFCTGHLPKFNRDMFKLDDKNLYLIPTAEVPLTSFFKNEILKEDTLPIKMCGYTPCFRSEAGSAGKDTKGIIRLHQFNKIELVQIVHPSKGEEALEDITNQAEKILKLLKVPYRKVLLCSKNTGFGSSKTYDLEVYFPSCKKYREVSSCSLYTDFQSRRSKIRFKDKNNKNRYVYTLNASGVAIERLVASILENYQLKDGTILIPKVLVKYFGSERIS